MGYFQTCCGSGKKYVTITTTKTMHGVLKGLCVFRGNYYNYRAKISHFSNKKRIATCQEISKMG